eukprot:GHVS01080432.1.p1 GENE.GHVS01080432.1~~GHVS01080432.1.p1  ORF type:complete len:397 (+),score=89.33 GHVS01080432.1:121-1311(+)
MSCQMTSSSGVDGNRRLNRNSILLSEMVDAVWAIKCIQIIMATHLNKNNNKPATEQQQQQQTINLGTCSSSSSSVRPSHSPNSSSTSPPSSSSVPPVASVIDNVSTQIAESLQTFHNGLLSILSPPASSSPSATNQPSEQNRQQYNQTNSSSSSSSSSPACSVLPPPSHLTPCYPCVSPSAPFSPTTSIGLSREAQSLISFFNPLGLPSLLPWSATLDGRYQQPSHLYVRVRSNLSYYWSNYVTILFYVVMVFDMIWVRTSEGGGGSGRGGVSLMFCLFLMQLLFCSIVPLKDSLGILFYDIWGNRFGGIERVKYIFIIFLFVHVLMWLLYVQRVLMFVLSVGTCGKGTGVWLGVLLVLAHAVFKPRDWNRVISDKLDNHSPAVRTAAVVIMKKEN